MKRTARNFARISSLATVLLLAARVALAAPPTTSDGWYDEGQKQYTLGNFDKAVDAFKAGFELETSDSKKPAYIYNIAQAYRQANNCERAVFFYKRFLAMKAADSGGKPLAPERRAEIDGWIHDGEACMKQQDDLRNKTPDGTLKPGEDPSKHGDAVVKPVGVAPSPVVATTQPASGEVILAGGYIPPPPGPARLLSVRLEAGATRVSAGNLKFPVQATGALIAGYPIAVGDNLTLEPGAAFTFTPAPFDDAMSSGQTAKMVGLVANVGARYTVAPKIAVRVDLGAGVLVFSGLDDGNPFTQDGAGTTGALTMFHARAALSADYAITHNLAVTLVPLAFTYSPAKSGFRDSVSSLTSLDFMVGLGYRM